MNINLNILKKENELLIVKDKQIVSIKLEDIEEFKMLQNKCNELELKLNLANERINKLNEKINNLIKLEVMKQCNF